MKNVISKNETILDIVRLIFVYISRKLNFQHILFFAFFVTFVIGDSITSVMMIESKGIGAEYNIIVRHLVVDFGLGGLITAKFLFIMAPLIVASMGDKRSYWFTNGVLAALVMIGLIAIQANLQELAGVPHMSPMEINFLYLMLLFILAITGTILDSYFPDATKNKAFAIIPEGPVIRKYDEDMLMGLQL